MSQALAVVRIGACCSVGLDAAQTAASLRARISRKRETPLLDGDMQPVVMGHLDNEHLPALAQSLRKHRRASPIEPRMLRLASGPLREVLSAEFSGAVLPLLIATPPPLPDYPFVSDEFVAFLGEQAERRLTLETSRTLPVGHTGMFAAIMAARDELLGPRRAEFVIVGGVDSYLEDERIAALERAGRLRTRGPQDAFTPGEAAGFMVLTTEASCRHRGITPLAWITHLALTGPSDRLDASLAQACASVLDTARGSTGSASPDAASPIPLVMAGLGGESHTAKAWGVTHVRNREHFAAPLRVEHPAEFIGDCGAALAPIMMTTAILHMRAGTAPGPALVWACSDSGQAGALLVYPGR
jgi:3-oxoacyl-[acyl-carrier-protein] synthase-1